MFEKGRSIVEYVHLGHDYLNCTRHFECLVKSPTHTPAFPFSRVSTFRVGNHAFRAPSTSSMLIIIIIINLYFRLVVHRPTQHKLTSM